jgi:CDGSH-type Zn-finger protein
MNMITTKDGTQIYYKDWGSGQPVVFSHGWPLSSDSWESQMFFLASKGYRCIAHDRRGHGRSSQPWNGNEMDTYADDLATLIAQIEIAKDGPYLVKGGLPLSEQLIVTNAEGESLDYAEGKKYPAQPQYALCRCGQSGTKPFCDGTHGKVHFDGTETATRAASSTSGRAKAISYQ